MAETDAKTTALSIRLLMSGAPGPALPSRWLEHWAPSFAEVGGQALLNEPDKVSSVVRHLTRQGARPMFVIGDSHSRLYLRRARGRRQFLAPFSSVRSGASARGLGNSKSILGAGADLSALVQGMRATGTEMPILLVFGQVDIEFVHIFKLIEAGATYDDPAVFDAFCDTTIDRYVTWLAQTLAPQERTRTFLAPVFPPALSDAAWAQGYVNAHLGATYSSLDLDSLARALVGMEIASIQERADRHRVFNAKLRTKAALIGLTVLDDYEELYEGDRVADRFLGPPNGSDHHLDHVAIRGPVVRRLWQVAGRSED